MKLGLAQMRGFERVSGRESEAGGTPEKAPPSAPPIPTQLLASPPVVLRWRRRSAPPETHFWANVYTLNRGRYAQPEPARVTLGF